VDFREILSARGLNTLIFADPYPKVCLTALLASSVERTIYVDLDTMFTAYLQSGMIRPTGKVRVFLPSEGMLVPMLKDVVDLTDKSSLVILDSVNSFYNLFPAKEKTLGGLNHLLSVLLMLLVKRASDAGVPVLATSMLRFRQSRGWVQSPSSKRLLQNKSAVKMKVEQRVTGELGLTILQHFSMPAGSELVLSASAIRA
jgi:hypothetical protein